jgi:hypothetical protein
MFKQAGMNQAGDREEYVFRKTVMNNSGISGSASSITYCSIDGVFPKGVL